MNYERSSVLFAEAQRYIPGGVNSPVRAFNAVGGTPVFIKEARGSWLFDEDGNRFIDYISSWGPLLFGHAFKPVVKAVQQKAEKGTSFGAPTTEETKLALLATQMVKGLEKVRFVNSGTEACMSVVRLARGITGRDKIIKYKGCYHGHADSFLIEAGSGAVTFGTPSSPGVTRGTARDTLLAPYNDINSTRKLVETHKGKIACIILEPVAGNMGCIPPKPGFLEGLRDLCDRNDILLIFDEVMTGFRLAMGGAQEFFNIEADLVAFGKIIGGGLPVGAFGGRSELMNHLAPQGPVYQAGTLSGNPLAMAAGSAMLQQISTDESLYQRLNDKSAFLEKRLREIQQKASCKFQINRLGSMLSVHFTDQPVTDFRSAATGNNNRFKKFFHGMLTAGVYLPPSAFESWFLSDALGEKELEKTVEALQKVITSL